MRFLRIRRNGVVALTTPRFRLQPFEVDWTFDEQPFPSSDVSDEPPSHPGALDGGYAEAFDLMHDAHAILDQRGSRP